MNLTDNRTDEQIIIDRLIRDFDKVQAAKEQLLEAEKKAEEQWNWILKMVDGRDWPSSEVVIVQDGGFVYEIEFDFEDYEAPRISRKEHYLTVLNTNQWR